MRRRLSRAFVTLVVVVLTGPVIALIMWPTVLVYRNTGDPALAALAQVAYLAAPYAVYLGVRGAGWALRRLGEAKDLPQPALAAAGVARIDLDVLAAVPAPFDSDIAQDVIAANKPGAAAPNMPILLYHGSRDRFLGDQFIPEQGVTELVGSWRSKGAMVDYLPVPGEHMIAAGWAMPRVLRWIRDVLGD
ncbi:secretory lipase family protein [Mycobacteroides abscessus 5S-0421]|nr:secretory lipase family protein [Mycobacteroides abscessus 5S-0421]